MLEVKKKAVSRRQFIQLSAMTTASIALAACGSSAPAAPAGEAAPTAAPAAEQATAAPAAAPGQYNEAPMLAELVQAGTLPPVDERLPTNPLVMAVAEQIGTYGGTMRRGFRGVSDRWGPTKLQDRSLAWYDQDLNMQPRLAESWEINEDATQWTFHLREGMKWSDGTPFTTAAVQYWYDNEVQNTDLTEYSSGTNWKTGRNNTLLQLEVLDDYTFTFTFADPNPLFLYKVGRAAPFSPGHYMQQFHINLTEDQDALQAKASEAGFESWAQYYTDRGYWYMNPEKPSVGPWISKNALSEEIFVMERNPYFFGVDANGNQLPYIDTVNHRLFDQPDVFNLWITNGEVDFQNRHVAIANFTLFKENEGSGEYQVMVGSSSGHQALQLNLTTKNERLREFFNHRDVRIALSIAVDREDLNELVFDGLFTPRQYSPISSSPQYYEKLSNAHIEYDPEQANALLDAAGYTEKNSDGFRLYPDGSGEEISFIIEGTADVGTPDEDAVQQVVKYFAAVGVKASYKYFERSLYTEHYESNEIEAAWWGGDRTVVPLAAPIIFTGQQPDRPWCAAWSLWKLNGPDDPNAQEPPADHWINTIWSLWDQIAAEPDATTRDELFTQILDIWAEELPMIGYLGEAPALIIAKNGFRNYLPGLPVDDTTGDEHLLQTETYFWEDPESHT
ncbi:MAG: ABC transporter substrate-binding protein [Caldilineaceae bacterium]|nr:ABC transporter substrate-binding protein [Caldilineaceae bacterium]